MTNKILAAGSVALMGAGALVGAAPAQAYTDADCAIDDSNFMTGLVGDSTTLCYAIGLGASEYTFTAPEGTTAVEAILGGAGGGAGTYGYGYGGNAGEILFINDLDPADTLEITVGAGGASSDNNTGSAGEDSILSSSTDDYTALGGDGGLYDEGQSGSGYYYAITNDGWTQHGAGAAGDASADGPGDGWLLNDPDLVGADNAMWPGPWETVYGSGGNGNTDDGHNWSDGGDTFGSTFQSGEDGFVLIHYELGTPLASTGVNTVPMGALAAGMLVAGGAGLAIARRARRSK